MEPTMSVLITEGPGAIAYGFDALLLDRTGRVVSRMWERYSIKVLTERAAFAWGPIPVRFADRLEVPTEDDE